MIPLVPLGATPSAALARALLVFQSRSDLGWIAPLGIFLEQHPASPWRASLLVNIAKVLRASGGFASAMANADAAWALTKDAADVRGRAVADVAIAEWLEMAATFAQVDAVQARVPTLGTRDIRGSAGVRVARARETIGMIVTHPEHLIASGPEAVRVLWTLRGTAIGAASPTQPPNRGLADLLERSRGDAALPGALRSFVPTAAGTSLAQVAELAKQSGVPLRMAKRRDARDVPVPAILHWRLGHFSAVVARDGDRYQIIDVALGGTRWIARDTLLEESSGYWLLPMRADAQGWSDVSAEEAKTVIGHTCPPGGPPPAPPCDHCSTGKGMPSYTLEDVTASLRLADQPTTYVPPRGPDVSFQLSYNHREALQPQIFTYANLGPMWTVRWIRFVEEDPAECITTCFPAHAWVQMERGGREVYFGENAQGVYPAHWASKAVLVRTSSSPIRYERRLPDGSVEVYALSGVAPAGWRRIYLTQIIDPQGLSVSITWDAQFRPVAITDAIGQVSTLSYELASDPLKVTRFTDPYGRSAVMTYNAAGQLASVTDTLGLTTYFSYATSDFISAMRTPYGTTTFRHEPFLNDYYVKRYIEATDPLGGTEHMEFRWHGDTLPQSAPASDVPTGFTAWNSNLHWYNTFYWDKRAWMLGANDLSKSTITHWMLLSEYTNAAAYSQPVPHSVKRPLESRVWYKYPDMIPGQEEILDWSSYKQPTIVARVLDDGTSQIREYAYNAQGQMTLARDPLGRETTYEYAANGIDRIAMRQKNGASYDLLETRTYNTQHAPLTVTDAASQPTTFTYNATGQVLTVTNAKSETTTSMYDPDGRLLTITGPVSGATTTYTYDSLGRMHTATDPDAYTVTTDYDVFDRPTVATYPDGTTETTTYDRLDVATRRDRLGRLARVFYDAMRRITATRDPAGRTVRQEWCLCGTRDALVDANGNRTRWERDLQGRVTKEIRADARETLYSYETAIRRVHSITDARQQVTTYAYFADDRLQNLTYSNAQFVTPSVSFTYDATYDRLSTMIDETGTTTYGYHPVGVLGATQVASIDGPLTNDTITYTYDELSRVTSRAVNGGANTVSWTFDALGRVTSQANVLGMFTYTYEGVTPRLATVTNPNGQTGAYTYSGNNQDHRVETIHHRYPNGATISRFDYTYNSVGNILTWQQQAGSNPAALWSYGYDAADQLTSAVKSTGGTSIVPRRYGYTYDPAGNRTSEQIDDALTGASYNSLNELISQQPVGPMVVAGTVSEPATVAIQGQPAVVTSANQFRGTVPVQAGANTFNVVATDSSGNSATKQYQVSNSGAGKTFSYDANGNLAADGTRTFEWDARNQLVAVNIGTHRSEYTYDGLQRRVRVVEKDSGVAQIDTRIIWCERDICEDRGADGVSVIRRSFSDAEQAGSSARFFATDHLGSVTDVTDASAALLAHYSFDPWGRRTLEVGTDTSLSGFTSHRWNSDASVWLTLHRAYDADIGRWISEDPSGLQGGINAYSYVNNTPANEYDEFGLVGSKNKWINKRVKVRLCTKEMEQCAKACGGVSNVRQCTVLQLLEASMKDGLGVWEWVDKSVTCKCKNDDDSTSWRCDNCVKVMVFVAALGMFIMQCIMIANGKPPAPAY